MSFSSDADIRAFALVQAIEVTDGGNTGHYLSTARSFYAFLTGNEPRERRDHESTYVPGRRRS